MTTRAKGAKKMRANISCIQYIMTHPRHQYWKYFFFLNWAQIVCVLNNWPECWKSSYKQGTEEGMYCNIIFKKVQVWYMYLLPNYVLARQHFFEIITRGIKVNELNMFIYNIINQNIWLKVIPKQHICKT